MPNYRRNEDKWLFDDRLFYNELVDISIVEVTPVVEPVDLPTAKRKLKITYNEDDADVAALIKSCRQALEVFTGLSLVEKLITWHVNNFRGGSEFPYGPVRLLPVEDYPIVVKDYEDNILVVDDEYKLSGIDFPTLVSPTSELVKVTYHAGYMAANFPYDLRLELLEMIVWHERHAGDEKDVQYKFTNKARAHRRVPIIL